MQRVTATHGVSEHPHRFDYDRPVIALGSTTNSFGVPGLAELARG